jgi:nucleoside-diphosphate-sugar epimerase
MAGFELSTEGTDGIPTALDRGLRAVEAAIFKPGVQGIYHVGDDQPVTLQQFLDAACRVWGYQRPVRIPFAMINAAAWCCECVARIVRTRSPLTRDFVRLGRVSHWGDTRRARNELIPELVYPTLETGLSTL